MNIWCKVLGHRHERTRYMRLRAGPVDGAGRWHADVHATCTRCGQLYPVGRIHMPLFPQERVRRKWPEALCVQLTTPGGRTYFYVYASQWALIDGEQPLAKGASEHWAWVHAGHRA